MDLDFRGRDGRRGGDGRGGQTGSAGRRRHNPHTGRDEQERGGDGTPGGDAGNGTDAADGVDVGFDLLEEDDGLFLTSGEHRYQVTGSVHIDVSGGNGGHGGDGGRGGAGGQGDPPGRSGKDGAGGRGGRGGDGGTVLVRSQNPHLLPMVRLSAAGGRGGHGGSGSPYGSSGASGQAGSTTVLAEIDGVPYMDRGCGLNPQTITVEDDGSRRNGLFTEGSEFTITRVLLENEHAIPMPAPFEMAVVVEPDSVTFEGDVLHNDAQDVEGRSQVEFETRFRVRVPDDFGIGYFALAPVPFTKVAGQTVVLTDPDRAEERFEFAVNHRYSVHRENFPEVPEEAWDEILGRLEGLTPHEQYTASVILLLHPILSHKREYDDQERAQEHYHHLMEALEGELFSLDIHERLLDDPDFQDIPSRYPELGKSLSLDFFQRFDEGVVRKLIDCMYFAATMGDRLEARDKQHIRRCGEALLGEAEWLRSNYPAVYSTGGSRVGASSSNATPALLFPILPLAALLALAIRQDNTELLSSLGVWQPGAFFGFPVGEQRAALVLLVPLFLAGAWIVRKLLFRRACPRCGSVRLESLVEEAGASDGARVTHRCPDCGARSSTEPESPIAQLHLDCRTTAGRPGILDVIPGGRWALWGLNAVVFILFPVPWAMLALMTWLAAYHRQKSFGMGLNRALLTAGGFLIVVEVGRAVLG